MSVKTVLAALGGARRQERDGWVAACPAHADGDPSLRVAQGDDGRVLLYCRAGCQTQAVLDAAGLSWSDLEGSGRPVPVDGVEVVSGGSAGGEAPPDAGHVAALTVYLDQAALSLQGDGTKAEEARAYALDRFGIDAAQAAHLGLGLDLGGPGFDWVGDPCRRVARLIVPFRDAAGVARGFQGRALGPDRLRWCGPVNPPGHAWTKLAVFDPGSGLRDTIITEGPGDALTAVGAGFRSVAIRGAALGSNPRLLEPLLEALEDVGRVIVAGDADEAGRGFQEAVLAALAGRGVTAYSLALPEGMGDLTAWREERPDAFALELERAVEAAARPVLAPPPPAGPTPSAYDLTDVGNARRLREALGEAARYVPGLGPLLWDGTAWRPGAQDVIRQAAHAVGDALVAEGQDLIQEGRATDLGKAVLGWGKRSKTTRAIDSMLQEWEVLPGVRLPASALDTHRHLLAVRNGTLDLRTGTLGPHRPEDFLTARLDVPYDPAATAPRWEAFLREVFPGHPDLPAYLQRLVGYGITGETSEQTFALLWGKGANGKSVLLETLKSVFRPITATTAFATFEERRDASPRNDLAALRGARLVMASEGDRGRAMSESTIKGVTGSDTVTARFLYKEVFEFVPTFLILLATNHRPILKGQDEGLWRRVKLIPFERYFAPGERDYGLARRLRDEAPGILAWAVEGARQWYADGLQDPPFIMAATKDYRETSDELAGFLPGVLVWDRRAETPGADVMRAYLEWADEEGTRPWTRRTLYSALEERGATKRHVESGTALGGIRLRKPGEPLGPSDPDGTDVSEPPSVTPHGEDQNGEEVSQASVPSVPSSAAPTGPVTLADVLDPEGPA